MTVPLHPADLGIIAVYFVFVLGLGLYLARRDRSSEDDYFVAGRKLGWFTVGASLFASNISSEHLIGLAADGYRTGLAVGNYEWGASVVLVVLGTVFVPFYVGSRVRTMPEFLERRFGTGARIYLSVVTILANVLVRISVALYAGALVMQELFGIGLWVAVLVLAVTTVLYTAAGGLAAVVYTDAVQAVVLLAGTIALTVIALGRVGGLDGLTQAVDPAMFDMVRSADDPEMPWTGLVLGVPVLGVWYWCTDQVIVQRVLGARSVHQARLGAIFAAVLKILPVFLFVLPGLCGRVLFPETDPKAIFPTMVRELLPVGITGLVSAGLIAALMSSLDSTLNSTGTLVSLDFFQRKRPDASPEAVVRVGRITTVIVMAFGIAWVLVVERAESLFQYLQQVNAAISPPIAAAFLVGVFWPRANHPGVLATLYGGLVTGLVLMALEPFPFLISAAVTFAVSALILVAVSLATTPPRPDQIEGLTWSGARAVLERTTSEKQRRRYAFLAAGVLVVMASLWVGFAEPAAFIDAPDSERAKDTAAPVDEAAARGLAPSTDEVLAFSVESGLIDNHFYRQGEVAAHLLTRSGTAARIIAAFPAGNGGAGIWFEETKASVRFTMDGDLRPVRRADGMRGVRATLRVASHEPLRVERAVLGSIRLVRDYMHNRSVIQLNGGVK